MNDYSFWRTALKDPHKIGSDDLPVHEAHPQPGFYRMRDRDGGDMVPVAIWRNAGGDLVAKVGPRIVENPDEVWTFCCRHPVEEQVYRGVIAGGMWPDSVREPSIGHNLPDDPFEALQAELAGEKEIAEELLAKPVKTKDDADKVAIFAKRIGQLGKKADEQFTIEKRPHLDAGRAVDEKWREIRETTKQLATMLKRHIDAYLAEERKKEQERQRIAREDAERIRREAEEARRKAEDVFPNPDDPEAIARKEEADRLAAEALKAEREAEERRVAAGRTGAKVTMRTFKSAHITDFDALLMALKDREEIRELVQSLANRAAKSNQDLPGMEIITEERAV